MLASSHPLRTALKRTIRRLHVAGNAHFSTRFDLSSRPEHSQELVTVGNAGLMNQFKRVAMATRNSLKTLVISNLYFLREFHEIAAFVTTHCENVIELGIVEDRYVARRLDPGNVFDANIVARTPQPQTVFYHFQELILVPTPSLVLIDKCMALKKLSITGMSADPEFFNLLTTKCGETLAAFEVTMQKMKEDKWRQIYQVIRWNCLKLTLLHLDPPKSSGVSENEYVTLLSSYGTQLESVSSALRNLCYSCPNLRLCLRFSEFELKWSGLRVAREQVESLSVVLCSYHDFNLLSNRLAACSNLVDLTMKSATNGPAMTLDSVRILRLHQLQRLELSMFPFQASPNIANLCGPLLKDLCVQTADLIESAEPFRSIVSVAPKLEMVYIKDGDELNLVRQLSESARHNLPTVHIDVVRCFISCKHLPTLNLYLHTPVAVREICNVSQPFRARGWKCFFVAEGSRKVEIRDFRVHIW